MSDSLSNFVADPKIASGYPWTPYRVEWRPTYGLDSREQLTKELDALERAGVKGWWYSAAAKGSYPLFRSQYLPYRDDADDELLQWLVRESHRRGMAILSWEYLCTAPMLAAKKPEWRYQWFDHDGDDSDPREHQFVCYNSPYGDLLMDYCVEVVNHLGFDGLWFDGSTLCGVSTAKDRIACCCQFCRDKYRQQTGEDMPAHIDRNDPAFRRYVNWRYADFMNYWRRLSDYVEEKTPGKLIAMNQRNRFSLNGEGTNNGCPLLHLPMKAMISTELPMSVSHLRLCHKYQRAINDNLPVEVWTHLCDGAAQQPLPRPEPDPSTSTYICQTAAACGGYMSFGLADTPVNTEKCMTSMSRVLNQIQPYIGGEPEECVGIVLSGATKDFCYNDHYEGWKHVHGAHNMFEALHWPTGIILDNMFDPATLNRYQAVVLPDVRCLSDEAATNLRSYVENGGTVLATGEVGTHDLEGNERVAPLLDDLFGIERVIASGQGPQGAGPDDLFGQAPRSQTVLGNAVLEAKTDLLQGDGLPESYMVAGDCLPEQAADDAEILATVSFNTGPSGKRWSEQGLIPPDGETVTMSSIIARNHGQGRAISVRHKLTQGYAEQPHRRSREVLRRLLAGSIQPLFTTDAPPNVAIYPWRRQGQLILHLLQVPIALQRFNNDSIDHSDEYWPEEFPELASFTIQLPGSWQQVSAPGNEEKVQAKPTAESMLITVQNLAAHCVLVLE